MIGSYTFNGVSSESFNLITKSIKRPLLPERKNNGVELDGISGIFDYPDSNEYKPRKIVMKSSYIGDSFEDLREKARFIAAWLSTKIWAPLIINDEPDRYYLAKVNDEIDLNSLLESGTFEVTFICQPFAFSVVESSYTFNNVTTTRNVILIYPGTRELNYRSQMGSKFLITATGSWSKISFKVNDKTLYFNEPGSSSTLIIDNINMTAKQDGISKFDKLDGDIDDFLELLPGNNNFRIDGIDLNCVVNATYIPLWL